MSEADIVFWALPPSSNSGVIRCFLNGAGIPFKEENGWGKTRTTEFIAKFPNNCCPAVSHGEVNICESVAILRYFCKVFPDKAGKFYSEDPVVAAKIDMLCDFTNTSFAKMMAVAVYTKIGFGTGAGDVASMESTKEHTEEASKAACDAMVELLEAKYAGIFLKDTKFLMSDTPTIADFRFAPMLSQAKVGMKLPERIETYLSDMMALEGYEEGIKGVDDYNRTFWM
jgi:glutathione S-transferase